MQITDESGFSDDKHQINCISKSVKICHLYLHSIYLLCLQKSNQHDDAKDNSVPVV
jgi:hypothetical protein